MANYNTTHQYQPLKRDKSFSPEMKKLLVQLEDIFNDIYSWRNRLTLKDFKGNALTLTDPDNSAQKIILGENSDGDFGIWITRDSGENYIRIVDFNGVDGTAIIAGSIPTETDTYTSLLLHFFGIDASTVFTNSSSYAQTLTANGDAQISTAQSKFGGSSGYFDGNGDYVTVPDDALYEFGTGDFTIDFWASVSTLNRVNMFLTQCYQANSDFSYRIYANNGTVIFDYSVDGTTRSVITGSTAIVADTFYHFAVVRDGTTITLYLNGVAIGNSTIGASAIFNSSEDIVIGGVYEGGTNYAAFNLHGYIDELRISKGIARWTANFTPPTSAYAA